MDSDETEPLPWYYGLALVSLGVVLLVVIGVTATVAMSALSGQPSVIETATGESDAADALEDRPSLWEQFIAMLTHPMALLGSILFALVAFPYLIWELRRVEQQLEEVKNVE